MNIYTRPPRVQWVLYYNTWTAFHHCGHIIPCVVLHMLSYVMVCNCILLCANVCCSVHLYAAPCDGMLLCAMVCCSVRWHAAPCDAMLLNGTIAALCEGMWWYGALCWHVMAWCPVLTCDGMLLCVSKWWHTTLCYDMWRYVVDVWRDVSLGRCKSMPWSYTRCLSHMWWLLKCFSYTFHYYFLNFTSTNFMCVYW